ncbi:MAG: hydroxyacid dehydrogenase [Anaerolineae bacterium]|nr:hydroxyacid dehydrogenase [Anaerolineae bacterium]
MSPKTWRAAFYSVEPEAREYLASRLEDLDTRFYSEPLEPSRIDEWTVGSHILSVFIKEPITDEVMARLPNLRLITTRSTGYDHIDLEAADRRGITVCNVPHYGENTVAEHTFALILALSRRVHEAWVRTQRGDFSIQGLRGFDLYGKTLGVVGAGSIGLHVIRIARGFGMHVLAYDVHPNQLLADVLGFTYVSLDDLLTQSDIVTLHVPLLPSTHHLMNRERLSRLKRGAVLINTSRGGVVDTDALLWALDEGILAGAGLDVVEGEEWITEEQELLKAPAAEEKLRMAVRVHLLLQRDNVVFTPHIAFNSKEALERILDTTVANIRAFLKGTPQNVVNHPATHEN